MHPLFSSTVTQPTIARRAARKSGNSGWTVTAGMVRRHGTVNR